MLEKVRNICAIYMNLDTLYSMTDKLDVCQVLQVYGVETHLLRTIKWLLRGK